MNIRTSQIASTIRRVVQEIVTRGLNDPRIQGLISVTKVTVADDVQEASVFVSIMPEEESALTMHGLRHAGGFLRQQVGRALRTRRVPRLTFVLDESMKKQARLEAAFARAGLSPPDHDPMGAPTNATDVPPAGPPVHDTPEEDVP